MADTTVTVPGSGHAVATGAAYASVVLVVDSWIPYDGEPPAFTVQRSFGGDVHGGDYVRGSAWYTSGFTSELHKSATRFRIAVPDSQTLATQSSLVSTVLSYDSIELTWGWPVKFDDWDEVSLIRSGFGHPSTVNDGVTVFRSTREAYTHVDDDGTPMSVLITDDGLPSGRWFYYTLFFYIGAEWVPALHSQALVPRNFGHQDHLWNALPPYYQWVDARFRSNDGYLHQFLNIFGFELDMIREYVESWQEAYHADFSPIQLIKRVGENLGVSDEQGLGEIRYRALVGQLSELYDRRGTPEGIRRLIEVSSKYETFLTQGRNLLLLPDDSDFATGQGNWVLGPLAPMAVTAGVSTGAGFNATVTRTFAGGVVELAVATGAANNAAVLIGTVVNAGAATGTGAAYAPVLPISTAYAVGVADNATVVVSVAITAPYQTDDRSPGYGRAVLRVTAPVEVGTRDVVIVAGIGTLFTSTMRVPKVLSPKFNGVAVKAANLYGFSVQYKGPSLGSAGIYWYDKNEVFISSIELLAPSPGAWQTLTVQGEPPVGAVYATPYVRQSARTAGDGFMIMGAMFFRVGDVGSVTALSPDYYLTLGSGDELIGVGGRVIGDVA